MGNLGNTLLDKELVNARERQESVSLMRSAITVVGRGRDGKTCTINSLKGMPFDATCESTPGIAIDNVDVHDVQDVGCRHTMAVGDVGSLGSKPWEAVDRDALDTRRAIGMALVKGDMKDKKSDNQLEKLEKPIEAATNKTRKPDAATSKTRKSTASKTTTEESTNTEAVDETDTAQKHAEFDLNVNDDTIRYSIYDNGGQRVFRSVQHLLLSRNGIYVVVFNIAKLVKTDDIKDDEVSRQNSIEHLRYWLSSIKMDASSDNEAAKYPPVVLVGTHFDSIKNKNGCNDKLKEVNSVLINEFGSLGIIQTNENALPTEYSCLYNLNQDICFFPVDNTDPTDLNVVNLRRIIIEATTNDPLEYMKEKIPVSWLEAMDELSRLSEKQPVLPLLSSNLNEDKNSTSSIISVLKKFAVFADIKEEESEDYEDKIKTRAIAFLKFCFELGTFIYFPNVVGLEDYCILNPQWLLDMMTYVVRDFKLHRFRRDFKAMELNDGESWNKLLRRGILDHSLLKALWPGQNDHFDFLLKVMMRLGIFGTLQVNANTEPKYTVPTVVTKPSVESREKMSMPKVLHFLNVESNEEVFAESIGVETFALVPFYNRLVNFLITEWQNGYSKKMKPVLLPSACNLYLGSDHPFSLVVNEDAGTIKILTSSDKLLREIYSHVIDACDSLNKDIYSDRLPIKLPDVDSKSSLKKDVFRGKDSSVSGPQICENFEEDINNIENLASFFSEKNSAITRAKAKQLAEAILGTDDSINNIELINFYNSCGEDEFKNEVLPEIGILNRLDKIRIITALKACPPPLDEKDYFVGKFLGSNITVEKEEKQIRKFLAPSYLRVVSDDHANFEHTLRKVDQYKESKVLHFAMHRDMIPEAISQGILNRCNGDKNALIKCVFLNACSSKDIGEDIEQYVDTVVCWDTDINDEASRAFAESFYHYLGISRDNCEDFCRAFERATTALKMRGWALIDPKKESLLKERQLVVSSPAMRAAGVPMLLNSPQMGNDAIDIKGEKVQDMLAPMLANESHCLQKKLQDESHRLQKQLQDEKTPVLISYATGHRPDTDAKGSGPGIRIAVKIAMTLIKGGINTYTGLHSEPGRNWKEFLIKIKGRFKECELVIAIFTKPFFKSKSCLMEINSAIDAGVRIIPVLIEEDIPFKDRWTMINQESTTEDKIMLASVTRKLADVNYFPQFGTLLKNTAALNDMVDKVEKRLKSTKK